MASSLFNDVIPEPEFYFECTRSFFGPLPAFRQERAVVLPTADALMLSTAFLIWKLLVGFRLGADVSWEPFLFPSACLLCRDGCAVSCSTELQVLAATVLFLETVDIVLLSRTFILVRRYVDVLCCVAIWSELLAHAHDNGLAMCWF